MIRMLFLVHRYLGIAVGLVMLLWTLSGVVMMYQEYPELDEREKISLLPPLTLESCCAMPVSGLLRTGQYRSAYLEMLGNEPVLRLLTHDRGWISYALLSGQPINALDQADVVKLAREFAASYLGGADIVLQGELSHDQWTVYGAYIPLRPLFKFRVSDESGTEFYISSRTGEVVQLTTAHQRLWGYLGAVIHWLYPTLLRQNTALWSQVVIWLTMIGIFLTVTGLYIGIRQYRRRYNQRRSPYRGMPLYHHYAGLIFGILTLSWVTSGLFSMNPWGLLEGEGSGVEIERLSGGYLEWRDIERIVQTATEVSIAPQTRRLEIFKQAGSAAVIAHDGDAGSQRLNPDTLVMEPLSEERLRELAARLQPGRQIAEAATMSTADAYYYSHHVVRDFPVFRVIMDNTQGHRYYLSPVSGQLLQKVDPELRWYRWLFYGLHRGDFTGWLRSRPVWDLVMLVLLGGVTLVCGSGSYMAVTRLRRDLRIGSSSAKSRVVT